jgi:class 3 adenylate cyclase/tetratricopeptide (TPR) repeat protein
MAMVLSSELLRSYIPAFLASRFLAGPRPLEAPAAESFSAAVLFADVSGFTPLAEQLARRGPAGTEALSELLNAYFGRLTVLVAAHGGEVVTFAGDGLLAVWPATDGDLAAATRQAGRCALAVGSALNDYEAIGGHRLSLRMGVGAGEVVALNVGGVAGSWRLLLSGAPVIQTSLAEQQAARGEVVLSPEAWMLAGPGCAGDTLPGGWVRLAAVHGPPPSPARPVELPEIGGAMDAYVPEVVRARLAAGQAEWLGELRRVTPLFLNLLDADPARADLLEVVQPAIAALQPILRLHEGSLKQLVVDDKGLTLIAVFGLPPLAHEDDAARAAKAALKAQAALRDLGMRCAIGVATGRAFCGAVGGDVHREYDVIGDVMNLSARLMQAASDTILCDEATQSAARSRLRFRALPAISVKGKADPIAVYCPLEPARARDRPWTIVGRDRERQLLSSRLEELWGGRSGLVLIEGEPGIGKSRLLAELLQQARARGVRSLLGAGDAVETTTPYHAWRPVFTELLDLASVEDVEARRARVLAHAGAVPRLARLAPLLNPVLALDLPDNELTAQLTGQVRADNTRRLLVRLLRAGAAAPDGAASPLLVALDDGHWFDSASWALTAQVASQVRPLLLAITTRPLAEPLPPDYRRLRDDPASDRLPLQPLDPGDTLTLVCSRLGVPSLPERVAGLIEDRAQGNPFFSEELAYALRDTGLIRIADGRCTIAPGAGDLRSVSFPDTVQGVVAGRIDRLPPGQELTLKVASVVGRLFAFRILRDIHPIEADWSSLPEQLEDLQRHDFTLLDTPDPDLAYLFKHVVTQEVAYSLLLYGQRRQLHRAVAEWYERSQADDLSVLSPLLAHHWAGADEPVKTVRYLELAGEQALRAGAYQETVDFLTQALKVSERLRPAPQPKRQARWHRQLADAYTGLGRLPESRHHADQAVALLGRPVPGTPRRVLGDLAGQALRQGLHRLLPARPVQGDPDARADALEAARAYERLALLNYYANAREAALSSVLHVANLAERAGPSPELARAYGAMSVAAGVVGLHALARRYRQWAHDTAHQSDELPALVFVLLTTSAYDLSVGRLSAACAALTEGLTIAQDLGDQRRWAEVAALLAQVFYHQGELGRLATLSAEMRTMASHADDAQRKAHALLIEAWHLLPEGRLDAAVAGLGEAARLLQRQGSRADEILAHGMLGLAHLRRQDQERARMAADQAANLIARSKPIAVSILEGYAGVTEVYLSLWAAGDRSARRPARQACATFRRYARALPIARPRAWLFQGLAAHLTGRQRRAAAAWRKSLALAERMALPYEQGRALYEIGRHTPTGLPGRQASLARAAEIFEDIGATYELAQVQAAIASPRRAP